MTHKKYFEVEFKSKEVTDFLKKQLLALKDISPLMLTAGRFMKKTVDENFETEGTHTGEKWQEWSDEWKKKRLELGRGEGKILNLDGHLRKSIQAKHGNNWAKVGTIKEYAAIHNFGGNSTLKRNKNMPKREFMRLDDSAKEELLAELYISLKEMLLDMETKKKVYGD